MGGEQFHTAFFSLGNVHLLGFRKLGEIQGSFTEAGYILTKCPRERLAHRERVTLHYITLHMSHVRDGFRTDGMCVYAQYVVCSCVHTFIYFIYAHGYICIYIMYNIRKSEIYFKELACVIVDAGKFKIEQASRLETQGRGDAAVQVQRLLAESLPLQRSLCFST